MRDPRDVINGRDRVVREGVARSVRRNSDDRRRIVHRRLPVGETPTCEPRLEAARAHASENAVPAWRVALVASFVMSALLTWLAFRHSSAIVICTLVGAGIGPYVFETCWARRHIAQPAEHAGPNGPRR